MYGNKRKGRSYPWDRRLPLICVGSLIFKKLYAVDAAARLCAADSRNLFLREVVQQGEQRHN